MWLIRLVAQDAGLSRRKHGFDSRMSYHNIYKDLGIFTESFFIVNVLIPHTIPHNLNKY